MLGALAGSVATIGASLSAGWAQRESARIAARAQHQRDRRQPREGAYEELISKASEFSFYFAPLLMSEPSPNGYSDDDLQQIREVGQALSEKATKVALVGPGEIGEVAVRLGKMPSLMIFALRMWRAHSLDGEQASGGRDGHLLRDVAHSAREFDEALDSFIRMAQESLDNDGSRN